MSPKQMEYLLLMIVIKIDDHIPASIKDMVLAGVLMFLVLKYVDTSCKDP